MTVWSSENMPEERLVVPPVAMVAGTHLCHGRGEWNSRYQDGGGARVF